MWKSKPNDVCREVNLMMYVEKRRSKPNDVCREVNLMMYVEK